MMSCVSVAGGGFVNIQCNKWMSGDLPGSNLTGPRLTSSEGACVWECNQAAGCNAAVRGKNGWCYLKSVSPNVSPIAGNYYSYYAKCS